MPIPQTPSSAHLVLSAVRSMMLAEVIAQPAAVTITVRRDMFTLLAAAIGETIDRVDALEEAAKVVDLLARELKIAKADVERLELHLTARDLDRISPSPYRPLEKSREERGITGKGAVVYLDEFFARELRDAGRSPPPEGGAA